MLRYRSSPLRPLVASSLFADHSLRSLSRARPRPCKALSLGLRCDSSVPFVAKDCSALPNQSWGPCRTAGYWGREALPQTPTPASRSNPKGFSLRAQQGPPKGERARSPWLRTAQEKRSAAATSSALHGERRARASESERRMFSKAVVATWAAGAER